MDEFDEEDEDGGDSYEFEAIEPVRARAIDYLTAFFIFLNDIAEAFDGLTNMLVAITARHANYKNRQDRFADSVRADLETIPEE